jgi:CDP-4-dehydro-6-deoxyglucose reductase
MHDLVRYQATLLRSDKLSERTRQLQFSLDGVERFEFEPGQYVRLRRSADDPDSEARDYSIASAPHHDNVFDLCLNQVEGGRFSQYLCHLEAGARVVVEGPRGEFRLRHPLRSSLFVATGTGIAPLRSMLGWILAAEERHQGKRFHLIFGTRTSDDLFYHEEFTRMASMHAEFEYTRTLSAADNAWEGPRGRVNEHVRQLAAGHKDMDAYVCGLRDMVNDVRDLLLSVGWEESQIHFEKYN